MKQHLSLYSIIALVLTACDTGSPYTYLSLYNIQPPTLDHFTHCFNYGCQGRVETSLPEKTQYALTRLFTPSSTTAEQERSRLIQAVALLETDIGAITGTQFDKGGTFLIYQNSSHKGKRQQDCVDESTNTTIYLSLLDQLGFIQFHSIGFPVKRSPLWSGNDWWHQSATVQEKETGISYAVDSWFLDNGKTGFIVPIQEWKQNWHPPLQ